MAFADLARADFKAIASGEFAEPIEYQQFLDSGPQAWKSISRAIVDRGDPRNPMDLGTVARSGSFPIEVLLSKDPTDGIGEVHERKDLIKLQPGLPNEQIYRVVAVIDPADPAVWRLHAVAG